MKLKIKNKQVTIIYSIIFLIVAIICLISNYFISHTLSWSLIVLSSLLLCYLITIPALILPKKRKIICSLISLTIFIIPYFLILSCLLHNFNILKIGSLSSIITLIYLWGTYLIYKKYHTENLKGAAFELLLTASFSFTINLSISLLLSTNTFNYSNILCIIVLLIFSIACFIYDKKMK